MKKFVAVLLCLVMVLAVVACGKKAAEQSDKTVVAIVVAGTFGDRSFYDSSKAGGDRLAKDFDNVEVKYIECNNDNHVVQMRNAADVSNIVVCVGWEFYDIETVAPEYPNVDFIWIDNATENPVSNVLNITYAQNEGSFLAGYVAAATSKSGVIGAVGGEDSDTSNDFIVGYKQGAKYYDPDIRVETNYTGSYDDAALGKECAIALHDKGADVIFQIASAAGAGVFEAAKEYGFYAIGVDSDQKYIAPEQIICSMRKEVGQSIYTAVEALVKGDASLWGTTWVADLSEGYVSVSYGDDSMPQQVSAEVKDQVITLQQKIVEGEIKVDSTRK